jgi:hypothetical protein
MRPDGATLSRRLFAAAGAEVAAVQVGDAESQVEGLAAVEAGIARGLVAVAQVALGDGLAAADALGHVVAGEFDVNAAGIGAECAVHLEESGYLVQHVVEIPGLAAAGGFHRVAALVSEAEIEAAVSAFPDVPLLFNWAEGGKTPPVGLDRLTELGYRIVIFPIATLLAATAAIRQVLAEIATAGTPAAVLGELPTFAEFNDFIGLPAVRDIEQRYIAPG